MAFSPLKKKLSRDDNGEKSLTGTPIRYLPLDHVYSATDPPGYNPSGSSNVMSKKVKARKLVDSYVEIAESAQKKQSNEPAESTQPRQFAAQKKQSPSFSDLTLRKHSEPSDDLAQKQELASSRRDSASKASDSTPMKQILRISSSGDSEKKEHFESISFPSFSRVYTRRNKRPKCLTDVKIKIEIDGSPGICNVGAEKSENRVELESPKIEKISKKKKNSVGHYELANLQIGSSFSNGIIDLTRTRERRSRCTNVESTSCKKLNLFKGPSPASEQTKKWVELSYDDVEPTTFVGLRCKVYWPLDDECYNGHVVSYIKETGKYHVKYDDGEEENVLFSKEKIKFYVSSEEMQQLSLKQNTASRDNVGLNDDELLVLAAIFDDCGEIQPGDIIWAKIPGHSMWPAVVVSESDVGVRKVLKANNGETTIPVQFFGTHDFAWITLKQAISFLSGLHLSYHLKCKQTRFRKSLEEAKVYLTEQMLPNKMLCRQNGIEVDDCESASGEDDGSSSSDTDLLGDKGRKRIKTCPFEIDDLCVISLGKIVTDSEHFHDEKFVWPEGYTAKRKFISAADPTLMSCYKMEVLRDPEATFRPLFRVTMDSGEEFNGLNPSACWNKIYRRIRKVGGTTCNGFGAGNELEKMRKSGSHMFGFSNPKVSNIIKELSNSRKSSIYSRSKLAPKRYQDLPVGYRPVRVEWKDLDKCNVCHMDEEYVDNVFLQCDKCRMMVHARCYGVLEAVGGVLWLCNLCCPGAPEFPPPCCLCPVIGGAMKPTTDGRWAHLACAIWIPETCLEDIKRMEPIDGLSRINKDRWKLLCSICGVTHGACIQCSNSTCRVAYHPLCARAAGLCVELEDEDKLHLMSFDEEEDEDNQCIRLFSFCKKHRQPSNELSPSNQQTQPVVPHCSTYIAPTNPSGCARTEPYDFLGRRGRKEPEAVAAACSKQSYVENKPYLVTGYCQNGIMQNSDSSNEIMPSRLSPSFPKTNLSHIDTSRSVLSTAEKYEYMKQTFRMRLAFGKSRIHKFGVFAKLPHKAGDMVIEYIGELVRPSIADRREHFIYNSLVGAGTYMFRIDDNRVIDATKAGSIAHLINHSCEPNCYSRAVNIHGEEHVIIFAKRVISEWEELTYDYRFFSIGEQLACYCGFPRCRGVVNDIDAENQVGKLWVPRSELIDWKEDNV